MTGASISLVTNTTSTVSDYRSALGPLADLIVPHLLGETHKVVTGLTALSKAMTGTVRPEFLAPGIELFPYQWAGVDYALAARRAVIGYGMGLGKTPTAITALAIEKAALAERGEALRALVVCPPSLLLNWKREFGKFAPSLTVDTVRGTKVYDLPETDVVIIGHSVVKDWEKTLGAAGFNALVIDESQNFKSRDALRTKAMRQVAKWLPSDALVLLLSGTFIMNTPDEAAPQLQILNVMDGLFGSVYNFLDRYFPKVGQWDREPRDLVGLHARLLDSCYCRLTFPEVRGQMGDRAPKGVARQTAAIEMRGQAAVDYKVARDELRTYLLDHHEEIALEDGMDMETAEAVALDKTERSMRAEALVRLGALRRLAGEAKVDGTIDYVQNLVDNGQQVIVFAWHQKVVRAIAAKFNARTIMGGDKVEAVEEAKERFQAGLDKVIVLNIKAGGTGHTLTAATQVVFAEFPWTPTDYAQAEARADRIGQTELVISHGLVAANGESTIDEVLCNILNKKAKVVGELLDGVAGEVFSEENMLGALLDWARS